MHASTYVWLTRSIPAFSCVAVAGLLILSFIIHPYGRGEKGHHRGEATIPQLFLAGYTVFLHLLSIVFPFRVCWAITDLTKKMREAASVMPNTRRRRVQSIKNDEGTAQFPVPLFVIIIPAYKEEVETLEETLRVLASHPQARHSYHVYLAMEEKEEKSAFKAASLCSGFEKCFFRMTYTVHPSNIPGEAQGKSSNEQWAAKEALKEYTEPLVRQNTIMTTMDADTHLSSRYFTQIARMHTEYAETNETCMYIPPLVFDRNLHNIPLPVRTADMMWAGAGISSLHTASTVSIPTSVYSLPMVLVDFVGGWDTDPGAIGEDMHMYLKCFFALSGNLTTRVVYAAASQCNVSAETTGIKGYVDGLQARYKQALRHMWGAMDSGYAVRETAKMIQRHRKAASANEADLPLSAPNSNWTAFYTSTGLHKSLIPKLADTERCPPKSIHKLNVATVFHRLFEAHFLPIHLAVILTTSSIYTLVYPAFLVPTALKVALDISGWCRLVGFCTMLCFFYLYERYHRLCLGLREEEMRRAGMLEDMREHDGFTQHVFQVAGVIETGLFPLGGFIFGAIPALQAVISHVFTDRITYVVSLKPQFALKQWRDMSNVTP